MTSLASGSLSSTSLSLSSISSSYENLQLWLMDMDFSSASDLDMTFNSLTANYTMAVLGRGATYSISDGQPSTNKVRLKYNLESILDGDYNANLVINFYNYASSGTKIGDWKLYWYARFGGNQHIVEGIFNNSSANSAVDSITITSAASWSAGTYKLWGIK
jgi:hypothetical protein